MSGKSVAARQGETTLRDVATVVDEVDSGLDALCELLQLAGEKTVEASSVHALLRPLQRRLSAAAGEMTDLSR